MAFGGSGSSRGSTPAVQDTQLGGGGFQQTMPGAFGVQQDGPPVVNMGLGPMGGPPPMQQQANAFGQQIAQQAQAALNPQQGGEPGYGSPQGYGPGPQPSYGSPPQGQPAYGQPYNPQQLMPSRSGIGQRGDMQRANVLQRFARQNPISWRR